MPYTKSFIAAMAIGIKKGAHPKLKEKNPNVYCDAFTDEEKWMMIALFMKENPKLGVKALFEPDAILDLAEEYANGGIKYLDIIYEETTEPIDALEDDLRKYLK
jgi:CO dehydrogenase/acetyl-CoA synthase gamma subunit (corrinoid Fe-S protein)